MWFCRGCHTIKYTFILAKLCFHPYYSKNWSVNKIIRKQSGSQEFFCHCSLKSQEDCFLCIPYIQNIKASQTSNLYQVKHFKRQWDYFPVAFQFKVSVLGASKSSLLNLFIKKKKNKEWSKWNIIPATLSWYKNSNRA